MNVEKTFQVNLENFKGPLDKVLELIEKKKLDISSVSLAKITDDFLDYLEELKRKISGEKLYDLVTDFVIVALKLLLIKTTFLINLNQDLEEEENFTAAEFENQLKLYKRFKDLSQLLRDLFSRKEFCFSREPLAGREVFSFLPGETTIQDLLNSAGELLKEQKEYKEAFQKVRLKEKEVAIEVYLSTLLDKIREDRQVSFQKIVEKQSREEIVLFFFSLVELVSRGLVEVFQEIPFGEIKVNLIKENG